MKHKILFIERQPSEYVSIEKVFGQIAGDLPADRFETEFQQMPYGNNLFGILKNLLFFRKKAADIYHITGHIHYISFILPRKRTVLTIHDLVFLHRRSGLRRFIIKKLFLDLPLRKVAHITTVSQAVKDEIVNHTSIDGGRINVINNPLIDRFILGDVKPFNEECPVILHIGTAENKNLGNLIKAANGLNCKLRIIGRLDDKMIQSLELNETLYENISGLDEHQIVEEYQNTDIVSFCSTYEGFGLPIIEAQAMRKPVITSDLAPMKTVAGGGAALVDPNDVDSIKNCLIRLIKDPEYRRELIEIGSTNVSRFDGRAIAARYADIYRQILGQVDGL